MGLRSENLPFINECFHAYKDPVIIKNFITHNECDYMVNLMKDKMQRSKVGEGYISDVRTSETGYPNIYDRIIRKIRMKCANYINVPISTLEPTQVTHYNTNDYYDYHKDDDDNPSGTIRLRRQMTFIISLNDNYDGGQTIFPEINKAYKLEKGDALFFYVRSGHCDVASDMAIHGGETVRSGEKWIINQWISHNVNHERRLRYIVDI